MSDLASLAERRGVLVGAGQPVSAATSGNFTIHVADTAVRFSLRMDPEGAANLESVAGFDVSQLINQLSQSKAGRQSVRLGPDEWLLIATNGSERPHELAATLAADLGEKSHTLVDVSHRNMAFELSSALAADVLNTGCPLDLSEQAFPAGTATRTLFAKAEIILCRCPDQNQQPVYRVECWRSFGRYLSEYLQESAELIGAA